MPQAKTVKDYVMEAKSQIDEVEIADVETLIDAGYQVLDVREGHEYDGGSIEGAINVPRGVLESACDHVMKGNEDLQDRDKKWLVLCATSGRSAMATVVMQQMGFQNVKNINGGMKAWKDAEMKVVIPD